MLAIASNNANECNFAKQPYQSNFHLCKVNAFPGIITRSTTLNSKNAMTPKCKTSNYTSLPRTSLSPKCTFGRPRSLLLELQKIDSEKTRVLPTKIVPPLSPPPCCIKNPLGEMKIISCTLANPRFFFN